MKKNLLVLSLTLGLLISNQAHAWLEDETKENIKEEAVEIWDKTKIITTEAGIISGKTIKNMGEALEKYSQENKDKIDRQLEEASFKNTEE